MAMIEVKDLSYSYKKNDNPAVDSVSFSIEKGEIFGFLGPSGAGKSTTQGVLSGLLDLQKGEIIIDGKARDGKPSKDFFNRIGMGFEIPNVYKKLTGLDNLKFHASLYDRQTLDPMEVMTMVGLAEEAEKKAGAYSKGMKQRLGFAPLNDQQPRHMVSGRADNGARSRNGKQHKGNNKAEEERTDDDFPHYPQHVCRGRIM